MRWMRLLMVLLCLGAACASGQTRWERSAQQKREAARGIIPLNHEPLIFLERRGEHFEDEAERFEHQHDPDNLKHMAAAGMRWGRLHFYKGFGLEYERPDIEKTKKAADIMHQLGMKVSLYMAGTIFTETLFHEVPEAQNWGQRDQWGHPIVYGMQTYRQFPCPNEPAYREYLKRILRIGVEEIHADEIAFDNLRLHWEPYSCRCDRCMRAFHDFLRRRYPTKEAVVRRFGLPNVDWIKMNDWAYPSQPDELTQLDDPVLQEWVRFRCESLANYTNDLVDYVKRLNPKIAVHINIKGLFSFNRYWTHGVYHPLFAGHADEISFDTTGYDSHIDPNTGALISQIRSYKMTRRLGLSCVDGLFDDLRSAVHMAFGYQTPIEGMTGVAGGGNSPSMEFFREYNDRYYKGTDNVADVAVLRNWPSIAYSIHATSMTTTRIEQVLIQYKIPFDLLFEEQLDRINRYGAVILAGQECVSKAQVDALLQYVRNGGTLVVAGNTGQFNEWRERRRTNPFLPARQEGKGKIVYIPQIIPGYVPPPKPPDENQQIVAGTSINRAAGIMMDVSMRPNNPAEVYPTSAPQWVLPKNHQEIYKAIVDGLPKGLSLTTDAPLTTVAEMLNRASSRETMVHLINFDRANKLAPFRTTVRKQFPGKVKSVTCFTPDADDPAPVEFEESAGQITFTTPAIRVYSMFVIAYE